MKIFGNSFNSFSNLEMETRGAKSHLMEFFYETFHGSGKIKLINLVKGNI